MLYIQLNSITTNELTIYLTYYNFVIQLNQFTFKLTIEILALWLLLFSNICNETRYYIHVWHRQTTNEREKKEDFKIRWTTAKYLTFLCLKNFYSRWVSYLRYFSYLLKFLILASKKLDTTTEYGSKNSSIKKHQRQI